MNLENIMESTGELTPDQVGAISHSIRVGRLLVNDYPEIADMYRKGMSHSGIAKKYDVKKEYDLTSEEVARNSIRYAIKVLIQSSDELTGLGHEHRAEYSRKAVEEGKGIHGLTPEQRSEYSRKAALAKGQKPWEKEETERAYSLSLDQEFRHQNGANKGRSNLKEIAQVLNNNYHNGEEIRNANTVKWNLFAYRKTLGN